MNCGSKTERDDGTERAACCDTAPEQTAGNCPCTSALKGRRLVAYAALGIFSLALLISQVGGILGIAAFVRTL